MIRDTKTIVGEEGREQLSVYTENKVSVISGESWTNLVMTLDFIDEIKIDKKYIPDLIEILEHFKDA